MSKFPQQKLYNGFTEQQLYNCMVDDVLVYFIKKYAELDISKDKSIASSSKHWNMMIEGVIKDEFNDNAKEFFEFCVCMAKSKEMRLEYLQQKDSQEFRLPLLFELLKKLN